MSDKKEGLGFSDISAETVRHYPTLELVIHNPKRINVSKSGAHKIEAEDGWNYYVQPFGKNAGYFRFKSEKGFEF